MAASSASGKAHVAAPDEQLSLSLPTAPHPVVERLRSLDPNAMTPLQAIQLLGELVNEVNAERGMRNKE